MKRFFVLFATIAIMLITLNAYAIMAYYIQVAHDDEFFIINGEKFEAQTYCFGWDEGDRVIFLEGSELGACATAKIYNLDKKTACDFWCE